MERVFEGLYTRENLQRGSDPGSAESGRKKKSVERVLDRCVKTHRPIRPTPLELHRELSV